MPKFLDTPSWYNDSGKEVFSFDGWVPDKLSAAGSKILNSSGGAMEFGVLYKFEPTYDVTTSTGVVSVMYQKDSKYTQIFNMNIGSYPSDDLYYRFIKGKNSSTSEEFYLIVYNAVVESEASSGTGYNLRNQSGSFVLFQISDFGAPLNSVTLTLRSPGEQSILLNGSYLGNRLNTRSFYAPTTVGSSGSILTSLGNGAPGWKKLYYHVMRVYRTSTVNNTFVYNFYTSIINDDEQYNNITSFGQFLYSNGYNSTANAIPVSGTAWRTGAAAGTSTAIYNLIGIYASSSSSIYLVIQDLSEGSQSVIGGEIYIASYGPSAFADKAVSIFSLL